MRILCYADTHGQHRRLPVLAADVVVFAGDLTEHGHLGELEDFAAWAGALPCAHKVVVAGNHDFCLESESFAQRVLGEAGLTYLCDAGANIAGLRFYGAPWQPTFYQWAFNLDRRSPAMVEKWERIPPDVNVLVTHSPPWGLCDQVRGVSQGCEVLRERVDGLRHLRLHVFGHIHEGSGVVVRQGVRFVNAACLGADLRLLATVPWVVDL